MRDLTFAFEFNGTSQQLQMVPVSGTTAQNPFIFGDDGETQLIHIPDFYIGKFLTTQALWNFIMGEDGSRFRYKDNKQPAEHVSWNDIGKPGGFLERINAKFKTNGTFRLPTEAEWEYAAMGGQNWPDGFIFAGSDNIDEVGWYELNSGPHTDLATIRQFKNQQKGTKTHTVGQKKPNQLGLHDMNGNIWEWCEDWFTPNATLIPKDGSAYAIQTRDRVLRGGCHHNGAIHCTNKKRYNIAPDYSDECIGFRVALTL